MTWTVPESPRDLPPNAADERAMLDGFLDYHRQTLLTKCAGLTAEQFRTASVGPSSMSLHGLVRHLAEVERFWFRISVGGQELPDLYCTEASPDGDFDDVATADPAVDLTTYAAECAAARAVVAGLPLDFVFLSRRKQNLSLRWVYLHMMHEYARHNGHADLIRERVDGVTGV